MGACTQRCSVHSTRKCMTQCLSGDGGGYVEKSFKTGNLNFDSINSKCDVQYFLRKCGALSSQVSLVSGNCWNRPGRRRRSRNLSRHGNSRLQMEPEVENMKSVNSTVTPHGALDEWVREWESEWVSEWVGAVQHRFKKCRSLQLAQTRLSGNALDIEGMRHRRTVVHRRIQRWEVERLRGSED